MESRGIICKQDPVLVTIGSRWKQTMEIGMDEFQRHRMTRGDRREGVCLPSMQAGHTGAELGAVEAFGSDRPETMSCSTNDLRRLDECGQTDDAIADIQ